jgi:hypothetical protein
MDTHHADTYFKAMTSKDFAQIAPHLSENVCDGITVIGNEFIRLDENDLIERFEVAWRPLASAALIQEKLANKLGGQPMRLVPA